MKFAAVALLIIGIAALGACTNHDPVSSSMVPTASLARSTNGSASQRPAYYDDELFTINMMEISDDAAEHTEGKAEIYAYADLDEEQPFISIIDEIPGEKGFSPLWEQFLIVFNPGFAPHQFTSEEDVDAAVDSGEITLVETEEVYRCSVVRMNK